MPRHLLVLNLGPVQGFIATARRTRDLWFGSQVLSEVSKAAALALVEAGAEPVFPAADRAELLPGSPLNVANRVLVIADTEAPAALLEAAARAARQRWQQYAEDARERAERHGLRLRGPLWQAQVGDVLEVQWAWVCWPDGRPLADALGTLRTVEAARKATRDFAPAARTATAEPGFGLPKSSLDGARETVLPESMSVRTRDRIGLGSGEQLDCPGLVKRLCGGDPARFASVSRVALDPWLRKLDAVQGRALIEVTEPLVGLGLVSSAPKTANWVAYPYDAMFLLPSRLAQARTESGDEGDDLEAREDLRALDALQAVLMPLWRKYGEPDPYYVLLRADGDRMGELIDAAVQANDPVRLRTVTAALARFAGGVAACVGAHHGECIYAGGDDVLAFLPVDQALACARRLHDDFGAALGPVARELRVGQAPTLSVGLAVQHCIEPLSAALARSHAAEKLAKGDGKPQTRDGLGIIVQTRSGAPAEYRARWDGADVPHHHARAEDPFPHPECRLMRWAALFSEDRLSDKGAYLARQTAASLAWADQLDEQARLRLHEQEAGRLFGRRRREGGAKEIDDVDAGELAAAAGRLGLERLAQELIIARWFAVRGKRQATVDA